MSFLRRLAVPFAAGLLVSTAAVAQDADPRFTAFVETYRDKIRKKLGLKSKNINLRSYFYSLP